LAGFLLVLLETFVVFCVVLFLLRLGKSLGLYPLFMFAATSLFFANLTAPIFIHRFFTFHITQGSAGPFCLVIFVLVLVYELYGIELTRKFFQSLVVVSILNLLFLSTFLAKIFWAPSPLSPYPSALLSEMFSFQPRIVFSSIFAFIVDGFFLMFFYTYLLNSLPKLSPYIRFFLTLLSTLWLDSVLFVFLSFGINKNSLTILLGHFAVKLTISFFFTLFYVLASFIFPLQERRERVS
jgi:uncharacterized PurR-regulated membrane protein YhhQ (DUF165 family)